MSPSLLLRPNVVNLPRDTDVLPGAATLREDIINRLTNSHSTEEAEEENESYLEWKKSIPSVVLYEGNGINLYNQITQSKDYYLYKQELEIINKHQVDIASSILWSSCEEQPVKIDSSLQTDTDQLLVADLGAGRLDKAAVLLRSIAALEENKIDTTQKDFPSVTYCAVDIQHDELYMRLAELVDGHPGLLHHQQAESKRQGAITVRGVCGSYNAFRSFLLGTAPLNGSALVNTVAGPKNTSVRDEHECNCDSVDSRTRDAFQGRKCLLWLGSSFTNLKPFEAADFLRRYIADGMLTQSDTMLIGLDKCQDAKKVKLAYSGNNGVWQRYISNAMANAGRILGGEAAHILGAEDQWGYVSRWSSSSSRHMRFAVAKKAVSFSVDRKEPYEDRVHIRIDEGELIFVCESYKYSSSTAEKLFDVAGLRLVKEWELEGNDSSVYLLKLK